ncbi:hypothetical protein B0H13DRAFT_2357802 [Mycena leptocephala]|nr:hypothetical protein B0H13DRAFT_2357802 [Mycena leptocephala]
MHGGRLNEIFGLIQDLAPHGPGYTIWDLFTLRFRARSQCTVSVRNSVVSSPPTQRVSSDAPLSGTMGDGCKCCGLERATQHPSYSLGIERQSSFEQEVSRQLCDCQVYGFDFSVSKWGPELRGDAQVNSRAHSFPYKIGAIDIDREGWEFATLTAIIAPFKGKPLPFEQMQIEIHLNYEPDHITTVGAFDKWCTTLEDAGRRPF